MTLADDLWRPEWPAPRSVKAFQTTRAGGVSVGAYASFNLGAHCGDEGEAVTRNRRHLEALTGMPAQPQWLRQVHGRRVVELPDPDVEPDADGCWTAQPGVACAVLTADCLPVLICDTDGSCVAAAHAGWRGLADGVLEATVAALPVPADRLVAWIGAAIGPRAFEIGPEVRQRFADDDARAAAAFVPGAGDRWYGDLFALARLRLGRCGVDRIYGGGVCTYSDARTWYSFRRDGRCGRMASLIWIDPGV